MDINVEIFKDGLIVLCVGFLTVFTFLLVLIGAMNVMGKIVAYLNKLFPVASVHAVPVKQAAGNIDEEIAVAIASVFIKQHG